MLKKNFGTVLLCIIDLIGIFIILNSAILIRTNILPYFWDFPEYPNESYTFFWWVFPVWLFFLIYDGLYSKRLSFWDEVKMLWKVSFFSTLGVFTILVLGKFSEQVSRTVIILMGIIAFPIFPLLRINLKKLIRRTGMLNNKVLILGAGKTGELIFNALRRDRNFGLNVVGFLDDDPEKRGKRIHGVKIHAGVDKAEKYIGRCGIEDIIIAMPGCEKDKCISLINKLLENNPPPTQNRYNTLNLRENFHQLCQLFIRNALGLS